MASTSPKPKMRFVGLIALAASISAIAQSAMAAPHLETSRSCSGTRLSQPQRFEIVDWDGDSREALGKRVYAFAVNCAGRRRDIIDLFLAAERSDRFKREGNTLMWRQRTERRSVTTREAGCRKVPKQVRTYPSDAEARAACRGQANPYACQLEVQGQDRWVTQMVEECWRARYGTREVPVWISFPQGHAPLPRGARIVQVGQNRAVGAGTTQAGQPGKSGGSFWMFVLIALVGGATYYFYRKRNNQAFREQVASARGQMGGSSGQGFGDSFGSKGFSASGHAEKAGTGSTDAHAYAQAKFDACRELRAKVEELSDRVETLAINLGRDDLAKQARVARETVNSHDMKGILDRADWGLYQTHANKLVEILEGYLRELRASGTKKHSQTQSDSTRHQEPPPAKSPDDLPETLEEACALLNVTPDTPPEEMNKVYRAMAKVWDTNRATSEKDYERREAKMKQLNAAKEFILGKR